MHASAGTVEFPLERSGTYTSTVTLIGQVIALQGTRIARELSRPRPNRPGIASLESARRAAVQVCRTLNSAEPARLEEIRDTYARMYLDLLAGTSLGIRDGSGA